MMITVDGEEYLTPSEAAQELGVPLPTIYLWCRKKEVRLSLDAEVLKIFTGSKYLIERKSVEDRARKLLCVS